MLTSTTALQVTRTRLARKEAGGHRYNIIAQMNICVFDCVLAFFTKMRVSYCIVRYSLVVLMDCGIVWNPSKFVAISLCIVGSDLTMYLYPCRVRDGLHVPMLLGEAHLLAAIV